MIAGTGSWQKTNLRWCRKGVVASFIRWNISDSNHTEANQFMSNPAWQRGFAYLSKRYLKGIYNADKIIAKGLMANQLAGQNRTRKCLQKTRTDLEYKSTEQV